VFAVEISRISRGSMFALFAPISIDLQTTVLRSNIAKQIVNCSIRLFFHSITLVWSKLKKFEFHGLFPCGTRYLGVSKRLKRVLQSTYKYLRKILN
jgi:hypothetical protein